MVGNERTGRALTNMINANGGYFLFNKSIARAVGTLAAVLFAELVNIADYYGGGEFYFEQDRLTQDTGLSLHQVQSATKVLEACGLLSVTRKGVPRRNWYTVNSAAALDVIEKNLAENRKPKNPASSGAKIEPLEVQKLDDKKSKNSTSSGAKIEPPLKNENREKEQKERTEICGGPQKPFRKRKPPLPEREPENDIERVEKKYLENYAELYGRGIVSTEKPIVNWGQSRRLTRSVLDEYGLEAILMALRKSLDSEFCVQKGYCLTTILSSGVLAGLINGNGFSQKGSAISRSSEHRDVEVTF